MSYTSIAAVSGQATAGFTTSAIDTTGADFIYVIQGALAGTYGTITDSKSNTWSNCTLQDSGRVAGVRISYCRPTTVGSGHTFTVSGSGNFPALAVRAFSGSVASPLDQQNGATGGTATTPVSPGSVTPSETGELIVCGFVSNDGYATAVDSGFTLGASEHPTSSVGVTEAYLIETSIVAKNPVWTRNTAIEWATAIATFKAGTPPSSGLIKTINGIAFANIKTINGIAIANIKTINGIAAQ